MKKIFSIAAMLLCVMFANAQYEINFAKYAADNIEFGSNLEPDAMDFEKNF